MIIDHTQNLHRPCLLQLDSIIDVSQVIYVKSVVFLDPIDKTLHLSTFNFNSQWFDHWNRIYHNSSAPQHSLQLIWHVWTILHHLRKEKKILQNRHVCLSLSLTIILRLAGYISFSKLLREFRMLCRQRDIQSIAHYIPFPHKQWRSQGALVHAPRRQYVSSFWGFAPRPLPGSAPGTRWGLLSPNPLFCPR